MSVKKSRMLASMLLVCMLFGAFFAQPLSVGAEKRYEPTETLVGLIDEIESLERETRLFYRNANTFEHAARYLRTGRYDDVRWQMLVGTIDPAYESAMLPFAHLRAVNDFIALTDEAGEAYIVDLPHLAAVVDSKRDFAGWAGDLITLASEIDSLHEAQRMIGNEESTFGASDMHSNIDALNLCVLAEQNGGSLARAMHTYYLEGGVERAVTSFLLRETGLRESELNIDAIEAAFAVRIDSATCETQTLALANVYGVTDSARLKYANRAFSTWLYQAYCAESIGHENVAAFFVSPRCDREGALYLVCRHCGKPSEQTVAAPKTHRFAKTYTEPTENEPGSVSKTCVHCGFFEQTHFDNMAVGDLDFDGYLTAMDYMYLKRGIRGDLALTPRQTFLADLNGDGVLDQKDYLLCLATLLHGADLKKD